MNETPQIDATEEWMKVGHYPTLQQAYDHALVILAMGEACQVEESAIPGGFELHAETAPAARISAELDAYERETAASAARPAPVRESMRHPAGWSLTGVWILALMVAFYWQGVDSKLVDRAASSSVGIFARGEWWRPFTALFLHADVPHLVGNLVGGTIFGTLVSRSMGPLRAWATILICGTAGNLLTARLNYPDTFLSIGASTAVFAALGILTGLGVSETLRDRARLPWMRITAPVLAGIILLSWLGSGNGSTNTDVMGHMFGFGSGLAAGMASGALEDRHEVRA